MNYRDLEEVRQIILEGVGLEVSYAYDDLVFPENTVFLIQFDDVNTDNLFCHFHQDLEESARVNILKELSEECAKRKCTIAAKGSFVLVEKEGGVDIEFSEL